MVPKQDSITRGAATAAILAPALLIGLDLTDGATRPGYQLTRHWISHLSLGERGWLGTVKLVAVGLLIVAVALGLRDRAKPVIATPRGATWRPVALAGLALLAAAAFPIDPGLGYPPGVSGQQTWHGGLHDLAGLAVVVALAVAAWRLGRDLDAGSATARWRELGRGVAALVPVAFLTCATLVTLDHAGLVTGAPGGLFERIAVYAGIAWLGVASARLLTRP
ncbi:MULTISPECIES: DUF998 domain-containing protein [unclassified Micromonospora]|uniref:DUF998 domain-containing protein n=1 Tax=unclassified Micromonospora TaxID=2617518 RepID=UPI0022B66E01|nr:MULTISPECIES: DUF998 domain-containing protein [unclassified Micromonospora]MCZ7418441.1 DUF998 domain-containing protein [Verrucosispora sp. WMMA2121]WBB92166.1 DUF998 domain-containing protein [Verrucosispora sp. WMMC514]